jgi:hypothetical protein
MRIIERIKTWIKNFLKRFHKRKSPNPVTNFKAEIEDEI